MSAWELSGPPTPLSQAEDRRPIVGSGVVRHVEARAGKIFLCRVSDGTGEVDLVFVGRDAVPGLVAGARCSFEGTVRAQAKRLAIWNPLYRLEGYAG